RTTAGLEDLRVVRTAAGAVTLLCVRGNDDVDVWLALGEPDAAPGAVLAEAITAVSSNTTGVAGPALPDGAAGPGIAVAAVESSTPGDSLIVRTVAFDVRANHDLLAHADDFGLGAARALVPGHFPGISPEPLAVSQARQGAMAQFTHLGFIAAAVTAVDMTAMAAPPRETYRVRQVMVTFHRPFGFVAVHRPSSLVLVAGWVNEPSPAIEELPPIG
ncbi:MAG: proteinase inhibitor I4 serpin, partial [Acidimicrobiales bacterium]